MTRRLLYSLLGELPVRTRPPQARVLHESESSLFYCTLLSLDLNGSEDVQAYLLRPQKHSPPYPVVLYNHAHGGNYVLGKDELLYGCNALQKPAYAEVLSELGFAVLCVDHWCFGSRSSNRESALFKRFLWKGSTLWGMMVFDSLRALDYLCTLPDIDPQRIGTLGFSMGSTMAWWLAALDQRIKVCIDICCLTDFQTLLEEGNLDGHSIYYYIPSLLKHFSTASINALIAPRPHLSLAGQFDPLTPYRGLLTIDSHLKAVYSELGASNQWKLVISPSAHEETEDMRNEVCRFLLEFL